MFFLKQNLKNHSFNLGELNDSSLRCIVHMTQIACIQLTRDTAIDRNARSLVSGPRGGTEIMGSCDLEKGPCALTCCRPFRESETVDKALSSIHEFEQPMYALGYSFRPSTRFASPGTLKSTLPHAGNASHVTLPIASLVWRFQELTCPHDLFCLP